MSNAGSAKPPIAAKERGPGPARYLLPGSIGAEGHDVTKKKYPAYQFGMKTNTFFSKSDTPGPCHMVTASLTRYGKDGTANYSVQGRHRDLTPFLTPSPNRYGVERVAMLRECSAPAYSLGSRSRYRKKDATPSPSSYKLPVLVGPKIIGKPASAAYTMTTRPMIGGFDEDLAKTPAPCTYTSPQLQSYLVKNPSYSLRNRNFMPGDVTKKPGPGAHTPNSNPTLRATPCYSMGSKHSDYICPLIIDVEYD